MLLKQCTSIYICQMPPTIQIGENDTQVHSPNAIATFNIKG